MVERNTYKTSDHTVSTPYKWDLERLKRLAKAINVADVEAEKNKDTVYGVGRQSKEDTRSQTCPA